MPSRHTKGRLLEVMNKVNPEFKLNEVSYEDAKAGQEEYKRKLEEVFSQFNNQEINVYRYDNVVPAITDVLIVLNTYDQENPYNVGIKFYVKERGQEVIAINLYPDIKFNDVLWKDNGIFVDNQTIDTFVNFVKMAAPYVNIHDPAFINQIVEKMYQEFEYKGDKSVDEIYDPLSDIEPAFSKYVNWFNREASKHNDWEEGSQTDYVFDIPKAEYDENIFLDLENEFSGSSHGVEGNPGGWVQRGFVNQPEDMDDFYRIRVSVENILDV